MDMHTDIAVAFTDLHIREAWTVNLAGGCHSVRALLVCFIKLPTIMPLTYTNPDSASRPLTLPSHHIYILDNG